MGRVKECGDKVRHKTRSAARDHAYSLRRNNLAVRMDVYRCGYCEFWHVGHRPRRRHNP